MRKATTMVALIALLTMGAAGAVYAATIEGNANDNYLRETCGTDTMYGRAGDDVLAGRAGQNFLTGGAGADRFVFSGTGRADTVTDFNRAEGDALDFRADFASYAAFLAGVTVTVSGGNTEIEYKNHAAHLTLTGVTGPIDSTWFIGY